MGSNNNTIARTFFITIWDKNLENLGMKPKWDDLDEFEKDLKELFDDIGGEHYTALCESAEGNKHIHEVVTFPKPKTRKAVAKLYGSAHIEEMRGTKEQAAAYIEKKPPFDEKGEKVLKKFGDIKAIENNHGARNDIKNFDELIKNPDFNLDEYLLQVTSDKDVRMYLNRFYRIKKLNAQEFRKLEVYYVEGDEGSGKTRGAFKRYPNAYKTIVDEKSNFPFDGYQCEDVIILDELRPGVFSHSYLMQLLDGYKLNLNIKGGSAPACYTKVIITSAYPLKLWYNENAFKYDPERKKQQFLRRINKHYKAENGEWIELDDLDEIKNSEWKSIEELPFA